MARAPVATMTARPGTRRRRPRRRTGGREVDPGDLVGEELGAEAGRLGPEVAHELGPQDAVDEARVVLDLGGQHELAAGLVAGGGQLPSITRGRRLARAV